MLAKLQKLIIIYWENLHHAQELQKQAYDKDVKPKSYAPGNKVWLNSKYLKIKRKQKIEAKFFEPFWVLYPMGQEAYKLKPPKKWRIHDVFHVSLPKHDITKKEQDEKIPKLHAGNNSKEYKIEAISNSAVYANKLESG